MPSYPRLKRTQDQRYPVKMLEIYHPPNSEISAYQDRRFQEAMQSVQESLSPNTVKARQNDMKYWISWCKAMEIPPNRPITPEELLIFVVDHLEGFKSKESKEVKWKMIEEGHNYPKDPHKWSTIIRKVYTLSRYSETHNWPDNPTKNRGFRQAMNHLKKKHASNNQPKAINRSILVHMIDQTANNIIDIRDRALVAFIFASGGRRRSEAEQAMLEHLEINGDAYLFHLQRTKTNKTGHSEPKPIAGLAARLLEEWLKLLDKKKGPIFRPIAKSGEIKESCLKGAFINRIIKKLLKKAGYDETEFSAHSLRSGFVTQAAREGCSLPEIKALTGHKTDSMVSRYYQQGDVLRSRAGNLL
jgi:integrase